MAVLDAEPALFGTIDQEQTAERPERLAAEALLAFLVKHDDALAGVRDLGGRHQPRQPAADHDYVRVLSHCVLPGPFSIPARAFERGQRQMPLACGRAATVEALTCSTLGPFRSSSAARQQHLI